MARYIDADELTAELKLLEMFITGMRCGKTQLTEAVAEYKKSALRLIDEQPTADVAPKSEVAREIFWEIRRVIGEQYENYVFDNLEIEGVKQDAIIAFVDAMKRHFFAIEKKCTEGNDERSD